ncbi:MAG: primary-amine oxidase, partial [Acidimicrobiales bacterium]
MAVHPLDPCTTDELATAVSLLRAGTEISEGAFFAFGHRDEPSRQALRDFDAGADLPRRVRLVGHDPAVGKSFDAVVSISDSSVESVAFADDGQAPITAHDVVMIYASLAENDEWVAALAKRGVDDLDLVHIEPWMAGTYPPEMPTGRVVRAMAFLHEHPDDNHYARPVEGLMGFVDTDTGNAVVVDHGVVPIPDRSADYAADLVDGHRQDLKALEITQPDGPSYDVDGHTIRWQNWHMRVSVHPIEGLVLHDVRYQDGERDRPILHRAALSDMVVPYGDTSPMHYWKHAFDAGETSLGQQGNSLKLGCDCLGEIYYFDAAFIGTDGEPYTLENAICLHEEDYGILWKHTNVFRPDIAPEVRRSRRLVVSMIHTIGNYEYGFYWYFYLDGTIELEVKLTGIIGVSVS